MNPANVCRANSFSWTPRPDISARARARASVRAGFRGFASPEAGRVQEESLRDTDSTVLLPAEMLRVGVWSSGAVAVVALSL